MGVSRSTVDELLRRETNPIPSFRLGRRYVIPTRELVEWLGEEAARSRSKESS